MANNNNNKVMQSGDLINYYLTVNINNICRICLEKGTKLMPIFDPIKPPHFSILIMACAAVQVVENDGLPPYICQKCVSKLNIAFQFKSQCESSDAKLRQVLSHLSTSDFQQLNQIIDIRKLSENNNLNEPLKIISNESYKSNSNLSNGIIETDESIRPTNHIENERREHLMQETSINNGIIENEIISDATSLNDISNSTTEAEIVPNLQTLQNVPMETNPLSSNNYIHSEIKLEFSDLIDQVKSPTSSETSLKNDKTKSKTGKRPFKQHQCDTCGKIFRTKPGLIHHIRIHTGERPYVCHLCDKRFINGGHLHTHMRKHTGEKNHVCAACNKAFATAQQLTKHTIAIHTSERPYGCTYCSKRFASSSNLNTHIKIHTGEKNYHCDQCGKAFSTKGQLYQHMLVHTGEKAFLCEYCNKRFSQKAHLIRHLKTHKS